MVLAFLYPSILITGAPFNLYLSSGKVSDDFTWSMALNRAFCFRYGESKSRLCSYGAFAHRMPCDISLCSHALAPLLYIARGDGYHVPRPLMASCATLCLEREMKQERLFIQPFECLGKALSSRVKRQRAHISLP